MRVRHLFFVCWSLLGPARGVEATDDAERLQSVKKLYEQEKWGEVLREAQGPADEPADFDYYAGMALSRMERWKEAREAFSNGARKAPRDARFLTERAGAEYKLNDFPRAKRDLQRASRLDPGDSYVWEFLGTIYLLEGNIEAALEYWNKNDKPRLAAVRIIPAPVTHKTLLDRAIRFSAPGVLESEKYLKTDALLENLGVFTQWRTDITPAPLTSPAEADRGDFLAAVHVNERNGWGSSRLDGAISLLRGLGYQTVYPSSYNLSGEAVNFDSLVRWDTEKRRISASVTFPLFRQPARRFKLFFDARNENWNLSRTFYGSLLPVTDLNVRRFAGGAELHIVESGRWDLTAGFEAASREFRNSPRGLDRDAQRFFTDGRTLDGWLGAERTFVRVPERRFTLAGAAEIRAGRNYAPGLGAFSKLTGELQSRWLPKARGDDYEFLARLRGGSTSGDVVLDELYQLGVERDNDLWLRGHAGSTDGRKGRAPLGRRYALFNSELNKTVYDGGFFRVQFGPFFDSGAIADSTPDFGSGKWLLDTGIQARIRVLGSVSVVLSYGRDLRNGTGVFYLTSLR